MQFPFVKDPIRVIESVNFSIQFNDELLGQADGCSFVYLFIGHKAGLHKVGQV